MLFTNSETVCLNMKFLMNSREYYREKYHCTVDLLFDWFRLVCFANKTKIVSCHTADSKPVKQEVYGTVILPPLVFPVNSVEFCQPLQNYASFMSISDILKILQQIFMY